MIERYTIGLGRDQICERFDVSPIPHYKTIYNAGPGQNLPVITNDNTKEVQYLRWGIIPFDSHDSHIGNKLINARIEIAKAKQPFDSLLTSKRCVVLADGFIIWQEIKGENLPFRVCYKDERPFAIAGLWDAWQDEFAEEGDFLKTFAMLTKESGMVFKTITERFPIILSAEDEKLWLSKKFTVDQLQKLSTNINEADFKIYPISPKINDLKENSPQLLLEQNSMNPGETLNLF